MGEIALLDRDGTQAELVRYCTSVNISCGAHAGDEALIRRTLATARGLRIGAHPGYPDPLNFGRIPLDMRPEDLAAEVTRQLRWFAAIAEGAEIAHVKPHGALYNVAVKDAEVATAIAKGVQAWRPGILLVGLAGSPMLDVFRSFGFPVWGEAFADRAYEPDGTLRPRSKPGALIEDPALAAEQALGLSKTSGVDTICVHSDTPSSVAIARAVRTALDPGARIAV